MSIYNEYEKEHSAISSKAMKRLIALGVLIVMFACYKLYRSIHYKYNNPDRMINVYMKYQEQFQNAVNVFQNLPVHQEGDEPFYNVTYVRSDAGWEDSVWVNGYPGFTRNVGSLWIYSKEQFLDSDYEMIYSIAAPLFQSTPVKSVQISADRKTICFTLFEDTSYRDCICYDMSEAFDQQEHFTNYHDCSHYRILHWGSIYRLDEAADAQAIDSHWYVENSRY